MWGCEVRQDMQWDMVGNEGKKRRKQYWRKFLFLGIFTKQLSVFVHREQRLLLDFHDIPYVAFLLKLVYAF
jgi:uncharacterized membrane protein YhaH (DUF805 family)